MLKDVPFIALTATATPTVRRDILTSLELDEPIVTSKIIFIKFFVKSNFKFIIVIKSLFI
jgi:superfamily II DNA helicase RecQ